MLDSRLHPFRHGIYFSFANAFVWMIACGTPMILMAEHIGASRFHTGLLYASVFLFLPVQILATAVLPLLGYKRQIVSAWALRVLFLSVPSGIAVLAPENPDQAVLYAFIASIFGFCFFRSFGACALLPWLFDILPEDKRGKYFSADSLVVGGAGIITLLFSSFVFYVIPPYPAYALLFATCFVGAILSILYLNKLPDGGKPVVTPLKKLLRRAPELCTRPSYFRRFLNLQLLNSLVGFAFVPFTLYYMKSSLGFSQSYILGLTALQFAGMSISAYLIRDWIDRIGVKLIFVGSHALTLAFQVYWLLILLFPGILEVLLPLVYPLVGAAMATFLTATNKYLPKICRERERALSIAVMSSLVGFTGGVCVTIWGLILKDGAIGQISGPAFAGYFALCVFTQIWIFIGYCKMRDITVSSAEAIPASGLLVRPFRYLTALINVVDSPRNRPSK